MNEQLAIPTDDSAGRVADTDDFYVRRINWLITMGSTDLIDEITDDCEQRRSAPARDHGPADPDPAARPGRRHRLPNHTSAAIRPPRTAHQQEMRTAPAPAGRSPRPVETGTRLAVARLWGRSFSPPW